MTSQLVIFRAFLFHFFVPSSLDLKKKSRKSTNKKNLALAWRVFHHYRLTAGMGVSATKERMDFKF